MTKILQQEDPRLRNRAETVNSKDFGTPGLQKTIDQMSQALAGEEDGVALAAPQIGIPLRIFIVSPKVFETAPDEDRPKKDLVFINPTITRLSKKKVELDEGCLSVRWLYGKVRRADKATVEAYDIEGNKFSWSGNGLMAQIFQHETDHLNGILFIDHAKNLREVKPEDTVTNHE